MGWCGKVRLCIDRSMEESARQPHRRLTWGVVVSLAFHAVVAAAFFLHFAPDLAEPEEEAIKVELVAPPEPEEDKPSEPEDNQLAEPPPAPAPAASPSAPPQPQAFESVPLIEEDEADDPESVVAETSPEIEVEPPTADPAPEPVDNPNAAAESREDNPLPETPDVADVAASAVPPPETQDVADADPAIPTVPEPEERSEDARPVEDKRAAAGPTSVDVQEEAPAAPQPVNAPVTLEKAKGLYSRKMLSEPRVRQALGQLPPERRIVQVCSIEALEQVRRARPDAFPDMLALYGQSAELIRDGVLSTRGGAFRSRNNWYEIDFRCQVDADAIEIVAFSFAIGNAVPRDQWEARRLKVDDGEGLARSFRSLARDLQP